MAFEAVPLAVGRSMPKEKAMSKGLRFLRAMLTRLFPQPSTPALRLCQREAAAIAERAAARAGRPETHGHAVLCEVQGIVTWDVCQVAFGSGWRVRVDDATGEAGPVTRWGVR